MVEGMHELITFLKFRALSLTCIIVYFNYLTRYLTFIIVDCDLLLILAVYSFCLSTIVFAKKKIPKEQKAFINSKDSTDNFGYSIIKSPLRYCLSGPFLIYDSSYSSHDKW